MDGEDTTLLVMDTWEAEKLVWHSRQNLGGGVPRKISWRYGNPLQYSCLGESHGQRSLAGYRPWGRTESNTTERQSRAAVLRLVPDSCLLVGYPEQGWGRAHPQLLMQL